MNTKPKVIISESAANTFSMPDGLVNFDRIKALNLKTAPLAEDTTNKVSGYYTIPRKAKPAKHSATKHKAVDVKYLTQRAVKVSFKKRLTTAGLVRNVALLTVVEGPGVSASIKAQIKSAVSALNSHMKKTDSVKTKVTAKKTKLRAAADKDFDAALASFKVILTDAGVPDTDLVESKGMMGRTVLLKVHTDQVVSIGRSDMARFRAAKKALTSTSSEQPKKSDELKSVSAKQPNVWGGVVDLKSKDDISWDGCSVQEALDGLKALKGTKYGVDWNFGDVGLEEGNIFVDNAPKAKSSFDGKNAVADFIKAWSKGSSTSSEQSKTSDSLKSVSTISKDEIKAFKAAVTELWPAAHKFSHSAGIACFYEIHGGMEKACSNLKAKGYKEKSAKGVNEFVYARDGLELCISEDEGKTIVYMKDAEAK